MLRPYHQTPAELFSLRLILTHPAMPTVVIVLAIAAAYVRGWL